MDDCGALGVTMGSVKRAVADWRGFRAPAPDAAAAATSCILFYSTSMLLLMVEVPLRLLALFVCLAACLPHYCHYVYSTCNYPEILVVSS